MGAPKNPPCMADFYSFNLTVEWIMVWLIGVEPQADRQQVVSK